VLRRTLAEGKGSDPESVKKEVIKLKEFPGLQGGISFDKNGDASRPLFLFEVEGDGFREIDE